MSQLLTQCHGIMIVSGKRDKNFISYTSRSIDYLITYEKEIVLLQDSGGRIVGSPDVSNISNFGFESHH